MSNATEGEQPLAQSAAAAEVTPAAPPAAAASTDTEQQVTPQAEPTTRATTDATEPPQEKSDQRIESSTAVEGTDSTPAAAQPAAPSSDEILAAEDAALKNEITVIEVQLADARAKLAAVRVEAELANSQSEAVKRELKDANELNNALVRELAAVEKTKLEVLPQYERCKQNHELKERAEVLRTEIQDEETKVKLLEAREQDLKKQLADASALYKTERSLREAFEAKLTSDVGSLLEAVERKLRETTIVDDEDSDQFIDPHGLLDVALDLVRSREETVRSISKQSRELDAVCAMQREAVQELEVACQEQIKAFTMSKDEEIRELIFSLQDERNALLCDIDEISRVNQDQKLHLQKGHVQRAPTNGLFRAASGTRGHTPSGRAGSSSASARPTEFRHAVEPPEEVKLLIAKNRELTTELTQLKTALSKRMADRTEEVKSVKILEAQIKEERKQYSIALNRLEASITAELGRREVLETENSRLAEAIEHLSGTLKSTKKHIEHVRGKTVPLPIE